MPTTTRLILTLACLLLAPATGHTEHPADQHTPPPGDHLHLSPALMELLKQEMNAIQQGMQALIPAIVSGNWQEVADTGEHIQHSYIMQQQLTDAQMEELHQALPPAFLELDQSFHRSAGMLAHAAKQQNAEVVNFYFYKLTDSCVSCHRKFAGYRFPGLASDADDKGHRK
jgi:cytochrome c556